MNEQEIKDKIEGADADVTKECFFGAIVSAGTIGHIKHLQQTGEGSFAAHLALDEFYKTVRKIADSVIETYQGYAKEIVKYDLTCMIDCADEAITAEDYLGDLREIIADYRYTYIPKTETHIHNELDNLMTLIDGVVYKLTFLR